MESLEHYIDSPIKKERIQKRLGEFFTKTKRELALGWNRNLLKAWDKNLYIELKGISKSHNITQESLFKNLSPSNLYYMDGQLTEQERKTYFSHAINRLINAHKNNKQRTRSIQTVKSFDPHLARAFSILYPDDKGKGVDRRKFVESNRPLLSCMASQTIGSFKKINRKNVIKTKLLQALHVLKERGQKTRKISDMRGFYGANFEEDIKEYYGPIPQLRDQFENDFPVGTSFVKPGKEDIKGAALQQKQRKKEIIECLQIFMKELKENNIKTRKPIDLRTMRHRKLEKKITKYYATTPGNKWTNLKNEFAKEISITLLDDSVTTRKKKIREVDTPTFDTAIRESLKQFSYQLKIMRQKARRRYDLEKHDPRLYKQIQHTYSSQFGEPTIWQAEFIKRYGELVTTPYYAPRDVQQKTNLDKQYISNGLATFADTLKKKRQKVRSPKTVEKFDYHLYVALLRTYDGNRSKIVKKYTCLSELVFTHKDYLNQPDKDQLSILHDTYIVHRLEKELKKIHNTMSHRQRGRWTPTRIHDSNKALFAAIQKKYSTSKGIAWDYILPLLQAELRAGFTSKEREIRAMANNGGQMTFDLEFNNVTEGYKTALAADSTSPENILIKKDLKEKIHAIVPYLTERQREQLNRIYAGENITTSEFKSLISTIRGHLKGGIKE